MRKIFKCGIIGWILSGLLISSLPAYALTNTDSITAYESNGIIADDWTTTSGRTEWEASGNVLKPQGYTNSNVAVFKGMAMKSFDMYFDLTADDFKDSATEFELIITLADKDNIAIRSANQIKYVVTDSDKTNLLAGQTVKLKLEIDDDVNSVHDDMATLSTSWDGGSAYTAVNGLLLGSLESNEAKYVIFQPKNFIPQISNVKIDGLASGVAGDIPSDSIFTSATADDFDGTSGIRWEKEPTKELSGFEVENGKLVQKNADAGIMMRRYFDDEYMLVTSAYLDKPITLAMYDSSDVCVDSVKFDPISGDFYHGNTLIKSGDASSFAKGAGDYVIEISASNGKGLIFVKKSGSYDYIGEFTTGTATAVRPVILSDEGNCKIDSIKVANKTSSLAQAIVDLNAAIAAEDAQIVALETLLASTLTATSASQMKTIITDAQLNLSANPFITQLTSNETVEVQTKYIDALAEMMYNTIADEKANNGLTAMTLEKYNHYLEDNINVLKLNYYTGNDFVTALEAAAYSEFNYANTYYTADKAAFANYVDTLITARGIDMIKSKSDMVILLNDAVALYALNNASDRNSVGTIINIFNNLFTIDIAEYTPYASTINSMLLQPEFIYCNTADGSVEKVVEKAILDIKALEDAGNNVEEEEEDIDGIITELNAVPSVKPVIGDTVTNDDTQVAKVCKFTDLDSVPWAKDYIVYLYERGIINGITEEEFAPTKFVKRAEFVMMVVNALDIKATGSAAFDDVPQDVWFADAVYAAANANIISGKGNNLFCPMEEITKQDAAVVLFNAIDNILKIKTAEIADIDSVSNYAKIAVTALAEAGVVSGDENRNFLPQNNITRAEAAVMIYKLLQVIK